MPGPLAAMTALWVVSLEARNAAPLTIRQYVRAVRAFDAELAEQAVKVDDLRPALARHLAGLVASKAPATVAARHASLHVFFAWLVAEGVLDTHPMDRLPRPLVPEQAVGVPSVDALRAMLRAAEGTDFNARRDTAVIRLFADTGLRRAELAGLAVSDVDIRERTAAVLGKGRRGRVAVYGNRTALAIGRYLIVRARHPHAGEPALWLGRKGPMGVEGVYAVIRRRAEQAGLDLHPHSLRHLFAHEFLAAGGQQHDLMRLGGWRSAAVMARYGAALADSRAAEAGRRLALGDRL